MTASACLVPGCAEAARPGSLVPLCEHHLALAAESGVVEDVLPHPCPVCGARIGIRMPTGVVCATCEWRVGELPDVDLVPPRVDVVYYLRFEDRVKVGTTSNLRQRLGAIWHEELVALERGDRTLEQRRHAELSDARIGRTEWFRITDEVAAHLRVVGEGRDPWTLHARWRSEALALRGLA
ncbi:GIY-YIG nuclease family protein [Agrococcus sp. SGAir0287]|uniref:GIY-YIG nuclease family protein n=1 Tax=Agrococcus sp. SGAir0287 TaxID=2070347 RepID=UPI0010CD21D2|nr:GIY-YIG nuclease family protein [Agrococcus sp. SGAir0287]QCR18488.1 ATPase [Agrococcus sp. SGAir0287]